MPLKQYYHDIDLVKNTLLNAKLHPITTTDRNTLGLSLGTSDEGIVVYDMDLNALFTWDGTQWNFVNDDSNFVHKTGDEIINGIKTFNVSPVVPDATLPNQPVAFGQLNNYVDRTTNQTVGGAKRFTTYVQSNTGLVAGAFQEGNPYTTMDTNGFGLYDGTAILQTRYETNRFVYEDLINNVQFRVLINPNPVIDSNHDILLPPKAGTLALVDDFVNLTTNQNVHGSKSFLDFTSLNNFALGDGTVNTDTGNSITVSQDSNHNAIRWVMPLTGRGPTITFFKDTTNKLTFQYFNGAFDEQGGIFEFNGTLRADISPSQPTDVVRLTDLGNYVDRISNQVDIAGDKTWVGNHTYHVTGSNATTFLSQEGWGITTTANTNFYTTNPFDGFVAGSPTKNINLTPYRISFNTIAGGTTQGTLNIFGPDILTTSQTIKYPDNASGTLALTSDIGNKLDRPSSLVVGNLYSGTTWNNFNDFTAQGNFTLLNGNIHITAGQSDVLSTNYVTSLSNHIQSYTYRATNGLSNAAGVRFGIKSINVVAAAGFQFWFDEVTRKINVFNISTSVTTTSTSILPAYTPGDLLTISATYTNPTITFNLLNKTTGQSISLSGTSLISMNRGNISILPQNTTVAYDIQNISLTTAYKYGGNLFVGDSIDNGSLATVGNGYTFQLNGQIQAGNGDYTVGVLAGISEIIKLRPETVYLKIGTNDSFFGIWQTNIVNIVSTLENSDIRVVLISPPPRNTIDMSPYLAFLQAQFPSQLIDVYTPLKAASGTGYNTLYDSGDGIHPNQAGHDLMAATVLASPLWHTAIYSTVIASSYPASEIVNTTVIPGYYNGLSTFKVREDGRIENASTIGVQTNLGALYYKTGGTIGVSSQVTINGSAVVANTYYANSAWAATSQGTNSLSFLTASNSNLVARMYNSGGMTVGVGLTTDPGANTLSVGGPIIGARFQGQSTASLTSIGTNLVQIATNTNANVVARFYDSGGATVGVGIATDPGSNNLRVGSNIKAQSFSLLGNASGQINVNAQNAAGTYNFNMPITAGSAGQILTSQGGGATAMTWTPITGTGNVVMSASPTLTGAPLVPTPGSNINTTQIVNGQWVNSYFGALDAINSWSGHNTFGLEATFISGIISKDVLQLYDTSGVLFGNLLPTTLTSNQNWSLPDDSGMLALITNIEARTIYNPTTAALSLATLNSTYSTASVGQMVICSSIAGGGLIYIKADSTNWVTISAPLTT